MYLAIGIQPGVSGRMYLARYIRPDISGWIYPARYIQPDISGQIYPAGYIWLDITSGVHQGSPGVTSCGFCEQVFLITTCVSSPIFDFRMVILGSSACPFQATAVSHQLCVLAPFNVAGVICCVMTKRSSEAMTSNVIQSLESAVIQLIEEQGPQQGLTLGHLHGQLRQMDHPGCPKKSECPRRQGPQAKLKELLDDMSSLGSYPYKETIAYYILRVESDDQDETVQDEPEFETEDQDEAVQDEPEFETDVVVGDKLVEILGRLEKLIGSKHPWNSKTVQVSELMVMKTKAQEALAFLHGRTRP